MEPLKKIIFLFLSLTISNVKAQQYVPFPTDSAKWVEGWTIWDGQSGLDPWQPNTSRYMHYAVSGDTLINNSTYSEIYEAISPPANINGTYVGGIRELNKQIFFVPADSINEILLYDFNKGLGDTLDFYHGITGLWHPFGIEYIGKGEIIQVDSILIGTSYRKQYYIDGIVNSNVPWMVRIVEGIGSLGGILTPAYSSTFLDFERKLFCYEYDGTTIYSVVNPVSCGTLGIQDQPLIELPELYPNPTSGLVQIDVDPSQWNTQQLIIQIVGIDGKVHTKPVSFMGDQVVVNLNLASGVYQVSLTDSNLMSSPQKLVIIQN